MVPQEIDDLASTEAAHVQAKGGPEPMPFIVGVGRSGTTLLRLMLDAHPDLTIPSETHFLPAVLELARSKILTPESFTDTVTQCHTWVDFQIAEQRLGNALAQLQEFSISDALRCFYRVYACRFNKPRWGDKTPLYNLHMLSIQEVLPEAHFVHVIRDGRDVALSLRHLWFGPGNDIVGLARHWCERLRESRQQAQSVRYYMEVRYENLIRDPRRELQAICRFIDLPYRDEMESYHKTAQARIAELGDRRNQAGGIIVKKEQRIAIYQLASRPPDQSRIQRWRGAMNTAEQEQFESVAGDMLRELGYETRFD